MESQKHARIVNAFKSISDEIQSEFQLIRGCLNVLERQINEMSAPSQPPQLECVKNPYFRNIREALFHYSATDPRYAQLSKIALDYRTSVAELLELGGLSQSAVKKFKKGIFPQRHVIEAIMDMKSNFDECHHILPHLPESIANSCVFVAALAQFIRSIPHKQLPNLKSALMNNIGNMNYQTSRGAFRRMISDIYIYGGDNG